MPQAGHNYNTFLTEVAFCLDQSLRGHSLLDIPRGWLWKFYWAAVHVHVGLTSVLLVLGISCICTGIQHSILYDEVNCGDGIGLTAPMVNMFVVYYGLMCMKNQSSHWAAFEHFAVSFVVFMFNLLFFYSQVSTGLRWMDTPTRTDNNWPLHFALIDFLLGLVLFVANVCCGATMFIYATTFVPIEIVAQFLGARPGN